MATQHDLLLQRCALKALSDLDSRAAVRQRRISTARRQLGKRDFASAFSRFGENYGSSQTAIDSGCPGNWVSMCSKNSVDS